LHTAKADAFQAADKSRAPHSRRPNFLVLMVDEERYPPVYETEEIRQWRREHLPAHEWLREHGMEFHRHYAGSVACCPSRATLFTGQYPSLHGVTQTNMPGKGPASEEVFWLDPNTVPTMGDYFRAAGYRTFYKGKWHISYEDIPIPGTYNAFPSYNPANGVPDPGKESLYDNADRLDALGFNAWIGPEPHGANPRNSGSSDARGLAGRDQVYAAETVRLIEELDRERKEQPQAQPEPWLIVSSFVNPHDITLFGEVTRRLPIFRFEVDPGVPDIPPPPTLAESLATKPRCQQSYRETYPRLFQPTANSNFYRRLYYQLQHNADKQMLKVLQSLRDSSFYEDTIVIFTSDHGDLLGAHGGLHQKWFTAYEEALHVPFILHSPRLFSRRQAVQIPTSHVDLLPTMLGLAGIDPEEMAESLRSCHTEVHPLIGRDLSPWILGRETFISEEPIYFMTDDDPTWNSIHAGALGILYEPVLQPNHLETVIASLVIRGEKTVWKYSRYFDNPQFAPNPGSRDLGPVSMAGTAGISSVSDAVGTADVSSAANAADTAGLNISLSVPPGLPYPAAATAGVPAPVPDEFELYNLTADPLERVNLAHPSFSTEESRAVQRHLATLLQEQCRKKRLPPASGAVPGMPSCSEI